MRTTQLKVVRVLAPPGEGAKNTLGGAKIFEKFRKLAPPRVSSVSASVDRPSINKYVLCNNAIQILCVPLSILISLKNIYINKIFFFF